MIFVFVEVKIDVVCLDDQSEFFRFDKEALRQRATAFAYWVLHSLLKNIAAHHSTVCKLTYLILLVAGFWWQALTHISTHCKHRNRSDRATIIFFKLLHLLMLLLLFLR